MSRHPSIGSALTGYGVMGVGDAAVQLTIERTQDSPGNFDLVRNISSSLFQAGAGLLMGRWWHFLDRTLPGVSIRKLAINQVHIFRDGCGMHPRGFGVVMTSGRRNQVTPLLDRCPQVVLTGSLTPAYMVWSGIVEAPLHGNRVDWSVLSTRLGSEARSAGYESQRIRITPLTPCKPAP
jgi:hypothetical protein